MRIDWATLRKTLTMLSASLLVAAVGAPLLADMTLEEIIENVRRNEVIYDNVDVTMRNEYEVAGGVMPKIEGGSAAARTHVRIHCVSQDGMFRLDEDGGSETAEGPRTEDRVGAFDGEYTRLYEQHAVCKIIKGRIDDGRRIQPHILLLRPMLEARVPLSVFLSGTDAVRAHPLNAMPEGAGLRSSYKGETEVDGLQCHEVWIEMEDKAGAAIHRHELLLAEDRNYLPVKLQSYRLKTSKEIPIAEAALTELREMPRRLPLRRKNPVRAID